MWDQIKEKDELIPLPEMRRRCKVGSNMKKCEIDPTNQAAKIIQVGISRHLDEKEGCRTRICPLSG